MAKAYRILTALLALPIGLWLLVRRVRGKEDKARFAERFGVASVARPAGKLLWIHAASVGEANSVLFLIGKVRECFPHISILLTTGTVTSARLMHKRLPKGVIHQYVPVDTPQATTRFISYWRPDFAFWVESEFWPNLVMAADTQQCFMAVVNARMSPRSAASWQRYPALCAQVLGRFDAMFAQSESDAARLKALGARNVSMLGNLKYDAQVLPCDESELLALKKLIGSRPAWLAASTHPGEEAIVASVHTQLSGIRPNLLTVIVPRHPVRGAEIAAELAKTHRVALRSRKDVIAADTAFYIADTMGELGLFYRLCDIVFMGGSLVARGGQNPLEPARLACAIVTGPHTYNFADIYQDMERIGACNKVQNQQELAGQISLLLGNSAAASVLQTRAKQWVQDKSGATGQLLDRLQSLLASGGGA